MTHQDASAGSWAGWLWDIEGMSEEVELEAIHLDLESGSLGLVVNNINDEWAPEPRRWLIEFTQVTEVHFVQLARWLNERQMKIDMTALELGTVHSLLGGAMALHFRATSHRAVLLPSGTVAPVERQFVVPDGHGGWSALSWNTNSSTDFMWTTLRRVEIDFATQTLDLSVRHQIAGPPERDEDFTLSISSVTSLVMAGRPVAAREEGLEYLNGAYVEGSTYYLLHPALMLTAVTSPQP